MVGPNAISAAGRPSPGRRSRISIRGVERVFATRRAEVKALGPLDLDVADGEFCCVVGPSGCGKSTLLRLLAGLANPTSGEIDLFHADPSRQLMSVVFQDHSIFPWHTVERNVRTGLDIATSLTKPQKAAIVADWLRRMGLSDFAKTYPSGLSGGMRQRVAIARAMAVDPEILLMDEPFASLDAQLRLVLQDELISVWEADRRTVVFVTHALDEAIFLGDRVVVMSARPGVVRAEVVVPFSRPRSHELRGTPEFAQLVESTWHLLRQEVMTELSILAGESRGDPRGADPEVGSTGTPGLAESLERIGTADLRR